MTTTLIILLAFFNGILIVVNRVLNAKLGLYLSATGASFWNHSVGFVTLTLLVPFYNDSSNIETTGIPYYLFLGGIVGACYVGISSFILPKIGATKTTVLVVAGQIIVGTIFDILLGNIVSINTTLLGILLVIIGVWIGTIKNDV